MHNPLIEKTVEGPLSSRALRELSLFSTLIFVFAALLTQFFLTLFTAMLLKAYSITFSYSLFAINFLSESSTNWSENQIYFIFGSGPVILTSAGLFLLFVMDRIIYTSWKIKLIFTWFALLMVNALPFSIIAGVFFYEGFGMAFQWLINSDVIRVIIALLVVLLLIFYSRFWQLKFLKASYTTAFLENSNTRKIFLKNIYFIPWIAGFIILLLFNWPFSNFYWRTFLLSVGLMSITIFVRKKRPFRKPNIMKADKKIFTSRFQILYLIIVLVLIWVAHNFLL